MHPFDEELLLELTAPEMRPRSHVELPRPLATQSIEAAHSSPTRAHIRWAAFGVVAFAIYGSLLPFNFSDRAFDDAFAAVQNIPLLDLSNVIDRGDWVISTALFTLIGFLLMAAIGVDRPRHVGLLAAPFVVLGCALLCFAIEFAQVYFPPRTVSLNDILFEMFGVLLGSAAWLTVGQSIVDWLRQLGSGTSVAGLAARLLPGYLAALATVRLMPFDFIVGFDELERKYTDGRILFFPWDGDNSSIGQVLLKSAVNLASFVPVGVLLSLGRTRAGPRFSRALLAASWAAPVIIEVLQLFVFSRSFEAFDIATGLIGVHCGRVLGRAIRTWRREPVSPLTWIAERFQRMLPLWYALWLAAVVFAFWYPFDFSKKPSDFVKDQEDFGQYGLRRMALAPFADYYWGNKYSALNQFTLKALSFMPLGILVALSMRSVVSRRAALGVVLAAIPIAVILEIGRYFLPDHSCSVTDVIIATFGAWLGLRLTQHIRLTFWTDRNFYGWIGQDLDHPIRTI